MGTGWRMQRGIAAALSSFILFTAAMTLALACLNPAFALGSQASSSSSASSAAAKAGDVEGRAHNVALTLLERDEGYSAVLYDNSNGLPTSEANAITETSEGFIWIGSYSGLIRYDGNTFERIDSTTGIASVVSLFVDDSDRLWIGTNDNGVAVMEKGEYRIFNKADGLGSSSVRAIAQDKAGYIYVATTEGVTVIDKNMNLSRLEDPHAGKSYIRDVRVGSDDIIYGITMEGAVFTLQNGALLSSYSSEDLGVSGVVSLLPDPDRAGYVYLGTDSSTILHGKLADEFSKVKTIDVSPLVDVKSMELFNGQLWLCADNGIGIVEEGDTRQLENLPLNYSADHIMMDYAGNLWFTSSRQGVMKIVPNQFSDVFEHYGLEPSVVNVTCQSGNRLFVGTDSGLTVLGQDSVVKSIPLRTAKAASGENIQASDLIKMMDGCRIRSIFRDSAGQLWFATFSEWGLVRYADGVATCFTSKDGLPSDRVRAVYERSDGAILAACTGGLAVIRNDAVAKRYDKSDGLENDEILSVTEATNGDIVLGSDGGGMYVIRDDKVVGIDTSDGLTSDVVMRVKRDTKRDLVWIVTSNSIAYMDADLNVTSVQEFPYSNNFDLYENKKGDMWVLSSNGVYIVPVDELLANGQISPVFYGKDDGLPCIATANSYSEVTSDGDLYIAGTTGVAKVNIDSEFETVSNVKVAVPFVEVDGKTLYPDDNGTITIPADALKLTIHSFVFTYTLMNPQVTYRLVNFDQGPTTVSRSDLGPLDYTNLAGGTYSFTMQLRDSLGHSSKEYSIAIVKQKALHETLWFRILAALAIAAVIALAVRFYIRRKTRIYEEKAQEQRTFIREMTEAFAKTIDMKDEYTNGHSTRVAEYTALLARELGYDEDEVDKYYRIALLHDIGKIGVPDDVLNKPGRLTDEEYESLKSHTTRGYEVLKGISIMPELAIGAGAHHERPDGKGYPKGLVGDEIPRVAQVISVADAFDAMYSTRTYRSRMNFERVISIIKEVSGTQLAPDVVDAFLRLVDKGEFRAPDDVGGGTTEEVNNIEKAVPDAVSDAAPEAAFDEDPSDTPDA